MDRLEFRVLRYQFCYHYCHFYSFLVAENADEGDHKRIRISLCGVAFCIRLLYHHQKAVLEVLFCIWNYIDHYIYILI